MQIQDLPDVGRALVDTDQFVLDDSNGTTKKTTLARLAPTPYVASITTGQWSGSGSDRYITVQASNMTADSILIPSYDSTSQSRLNGPVWCVPAAGSFTIHTTAIPSNTVTIMVQFVGTLGTAQYQVLSDVYSKSQVDSIVAQSTANYDLGPQATMPNLTGNGLKGFVLTQNTSIDSYYIPAGARIFGYMYSGIFHGACVYMGATFTTLRYQDGVGWSVLQRFGS